MSRLTIALSLVIFCYLTEATESWSDDTSWLNFIIEHEVLFNEVDKFAKSLRNSKTVSHLEVRRWDKILSRHNASDKIIMERMMGHLRNRVRFDSAFHNLSQSDELEEIVVIGRLFDQFPMDPSEFSYHDILGMRGIRQTANELYRDGAYDQAYPLLLNLAKRGFKDSQSRLAYILFRGTDDIPKSNLRALGWLATAAHGETEPMFRVLFKRFMKEVPDAVLPTVTAVVDGYRTKYDSSDYMDCTTNHRFNSGVVKRTYCQYKLEAKVEACRGIRCAAERTVP